LVELNKLIMKIKIKRDQSVKFYPESLEEVVVLNNFIEEIKHLSTIKSKNMV